LSLLVTQSGHFTSMEFPVILNAVGRPGGGAKGNWHVS
jgi:hypothetical protein